MCGEPEFVEEDALGLTDAIRMAFKTEATNKIMDPGMSPQDVRTKLESMGYGGQWGNLLASIHTVIKRLHDKGEIEAAGNFYGRDTFRWKHDQVPPDHPLHRLKAIQREYRIKPISKDDK